MTSWLLKISSSQVLSYIDRINYTYNTYICILIFSFVLLIIIISSNIKNIQIECTKFVVYWVIANPSKYRSGVYTIQLVVPAKVTNLQKYGCAGVLEPLIHDIHTLEEDGVFIDSIGQNGKGTILCWHSGRSWISWLSGVIQSRVRLQILDSHKWTVPQTPEVREEYLFREQKQVQNVRGNESSSSCFAVKGECVLHVSLDYFHDITDVPPDKLHDLLKAIMPPELALCIKKWLLSTSV